MTALIRKLEVLRKMAILLPPAKDINVKDIMLRCTITVGEMPSRTCIEIVEQTRIGARSLFMGFGSTEDAAANDLHKQFRLLAGSAANFRRLMHLNHVEDL